MIRVRFAKGWRMYQPGEVAAFGAAIVDQLVATGFATVIDEKAEGADAKVAEKATKAKAKPAAEEAASEDGGQR